jgi:leucine dehydrogenase
MSKLSLLKLTPQEFVEFLKENKIKKFYFVYDQGKKRVISSHKNLKPIGDFINNDKRDFNFHEGLFFNVSKKYDTLQGAFIHRTNRGQAAGGVRYWSYDTLEDYLRDGLRLAKGMTHKNALAGLWWGGGKGVMAVNPAYEKNNNEVREFIYKEYGEFLTSLKGCYVTAEDVGTNVNDMANIFSKTRFTTCIPEYLGGSGNPSIPTARGVVSGMEAAVKFAFNSNLEGKIIAIQGAGNVGRSLVDFLLEKNVKKIFICDISEENISKLKSKISSPKVETFFVGKNDTKIFETECDIFSPCATGAVLNKFTIPVIKAKIVCGAANNQLEDPDKDAEAIHNRKIFYIPDFLTNRMGIVTCANEQYGYINNDPFIEMHLNKNWKYSIYKTSLEVLKESKLSGQPTAKVAVKIADKLSKINHPIFGHRGKLIIQSLVDDKWYEKN